MYDKGNINDLKLLISDRQKEIAALSAQLEAPKEEVVYNAGDGRVGYYRVGESSDTEKRISDLKVEIESYRTRINQIKEEQRKNNELKEQNRQERQEIHNQEKKDEKDRAILEEKIRKANFRRVIELYKNSTNFLERALLNFQGKGLKKDYTQRELDFLIAVYYGQATFQSSKHETIESSTADYFEAERRKKESDKRDFKKIISDQNLEFLMDQEEINKGRTR